MHLVCYPYRSCCVHFGLAAVLSLLFFAVLFILVLHIINIVYNYYYYPAATCNGVWSSTFLQIGARCEFLARYSATAGLDALHEDQKEDCTMDGRLVKKIYVIIHHGHTYWQARSIGVVPNPVTQFTSHRCTSTRCFTISRWPYLYTSLIKHLLN